jgi:Fructose-bisphosphate aldolase class-I
MSEEESTLNLQALQHELQRVGVTPGWRMTFSYGRALQSATLKVRRSPTSALSHDLQLWPGAAVGHVQGDPTLSPSDLRVSFGGNEESSAAMSLGRGRRLMTRQLHRCSRLQCALASAGCLSAQ